jgi:hypothetical protein
MTSTVGLICLALASPPPTPAVPTSEWLLPGRCGINCLFTYFKLLEGMRVSERSVRYDEVVAAVAIDPAKGSSLADLAEGANRLGARVTVRKVDPADFRRLPTPFIAHIDNLDRGGTGHFITVFAVQQSAGSDKTIVRFIDGSNGLEHASLLDALSPRLSGFVVLRTDSRSRLSSPPVLLGALLAGAVLGLVTRHSKSPPAGPGAR